MNEVREEAKGFVLSAMIKAKFGTNSKEKKIFEELKIKFINKNGSWRNVDEVLLDVLAQLKEVYPNGTERMANAAVLLGKMAGQFDYLYEFAKRERIKSDESN